MDGARQELLASNSPGPVKSASLDASAAMLSMGPRGAGRTGRRMSQEMQGPPPDTLIVTVMKAEGVLAKDKGGTSDPFAEVKIGRQSHKTKAIPKTVNPEWNETFTLDINTPGSVLEVVLFDQDKGLIMSGTEFLGCVEIQVDSLSVGVIEDWHTLQWSKQYQKKQENVTGRVLLRIEAKCSTEGKSAEEVDELKKVPKPVRDVKKAEQMYSQGFGTLEVTVIGAERLMAADRGGTSDPYLELVLGGKKVGKTQTQKKTLNPKWGEVFTLEVPQRAVCLEVLVHDADMVGSAFLGMACVNLDDLPSGKDVIKSYNLHPRSFKDKNPISGTVRLLCNYLTHAPMGLQMPKVDKTAMDARRQKLGVGAVTIGVVGCAGLMGSDPASHPHVYVEVKVGESRGMTEPSTSTCPCWNQPFLLDVATGCQVAEVTVFEKASAIAMLSKDQVLGVVSVLLSDMPSEPSFEWYPLVGLRASDLATGAVKLALCAHVIPEIAVERPRRDMNAVKDNASRGLGTIEVTVVAAKQLVGSDETGTREAMVGVQVGQSRQQTEKMDRSLNPVFNKPMTFKVDPGVSVMKVSVLDKGGKGAKEFGMVEIDLEDLEEDDEVDDWWCFTAPDRKDNRIMGEIRLCLNYVSKTVYTDPAALGLQQQAIGDVEVIVIAGRGIGTEVDDGGSNKALVEGDWNRLQPGDLLRVQAQIGEAISEASPVGREAPTPVWNEKFALKLPHPSSVLEVHVVQEDVDGEVSMVPFGTGQVPLGEFTDGAQEEQWIELRAPIPKRLQNQGSVGKLIGSIQVLVTVRRNYGFNLELLGGLVACPWKCGTHFMPDDAMTHFMQCPLAPDPTAQVSCVHMAIGCQFRGPRHGMKEHLAVCAFEPVKGVVRGYVKEIRSLRKTVEGQEEELTMLRDRIRGLEEALAGRPDTAGSAQERHKAKRAQLHPKEDPSEGAGLVEFEFTAEVTREKIIKWLPKGCSYTLEGHTDGVLSLGHVNDFNKLLSGSADRTVRVWDISQHEPVCDGELKGHRGGVTSIAVGGRRAVTGSADCTMKIWDMQQMKESGKFQGHKGLIHGIIVLGDMAISASQDKCIKIWDLRLGDCVTTLETRSRGCYGLAAHDVKLIQASGSKIFTWDLRKIASSTMNEEQRNNFGRYDTLTGNATGVYGHQMVGDRLYTSAVDNSVRLWDLRSMQVKSKIVGHSDFVRTLAVAGERLITGSDDKSIRIWDLEFHDCTKVLRGHGSYITAIKAARARLFSASMDKTIKVWE